MVFNNDLDERYRLWMKYSFLVMHTKRVFHAGMFDGLGIVWRTESVCADAFRSINDLGKKVVWC